jgi:hypothetical protein
MLIRITKAGNKIISKPFKKIPPDRNRGEQLKTQACNKAGGSNSKGSGS